MGHTFKELRENPVNGNIIADLYFNNVLICGIEYKFNYDTEYYLIVDSFFVENGLYNDIYDNEDQLFYELTCNKALLQHAFNDLGIGG